MPRNLKPKPNNKLTERYRSESTIINKESYRDFQTKIGDNLIVVDEVVPKSVCLDLYENLYDDENSKWSPNIGYGKHDDWPVDEWGYTVVEPATDKWIKTGQTNRVKKIWKIFKDYMKEEFDVTPILHGSHVNATTFGQESRIHRDSSDGTHAFVIIFINDDMNAYDGGELQTYIDVEPNENKNKDFHKSETNLSVSPVVGRIAIADARVLHRGLAPTRFYPKSRITIVFKFKFEDVNESFKKLNFHR